MSFLLSWTFAEVPSAMAARTMKLVANSLIKLANLVEAKVCVSNLVVIQLTCFIFLPLKKIVLIEIQV
jgi:hypothetical protein